MLHPTHWLPCALLALAPGPALGNDAEAPADEFSSVWYDGRAELCGYRWSGERYGEQRTGEAVAIFVTEPFDEELHVKLDDPARREGREVTALKLNLVRDFQTGLYDYNTMVSCFLRADDFTPMKLSFSSAEWCGHVYEELDFRPRETRISVRSYFQGETGQKTLAAPKGGLVEEQLFVWLRGLRGAPLEAGDTRELPFLAGPFERRLRHAQASWGTATITRAKVPQEVEVPAGKFRALSYRVDAPDGRVGVFQIEEQAPHRLLAWSWTRAGSVTDSGALSGSRRLTYWQLHGEGQESRRSELGLD